MVLLFLLFGCAQQNGDKNGNNNNSENFSFIFCDKCSDESEQTADFCKMNGSQFVSCEFVSRCGEGIFLDGSCSQPSVCGNGICETGETSTCPDCKELTECANGGITGKEAVPKNLFAWDFDSISSTTCDASNPSHFNCDSVQALISLMQKLEAVKEYLNKNGIPQDSLTVDGLGTLYKSGNGVSLNFKWALLSDNLESKELFKDFGEKLEPGFLDYFSAPQWVSKWEPFIHSAASDEEPFLDIEYKKDFLQTVNLNEKLHPAGKYDVVVKINFDEKPLEFLKNNGVSKTPSAKINVSLELMDQLYDPVVLDLAFDELLGSENPNRDYGIRWPVVSPPIKLASSNGVIEKFFDSRIYTNGANEVLGSDPFLSPIIIEASYFNPPGIIGHSAARRNVFFGNAPVLFQTILEKGTARPQIGDEQGKVVFGQQIFASFNDTAPIPLAAFVSPDSTQVFGPKNSSSLNVLSEPWFRAAEFGKIWEGCEKFEFTDTAPVILELCGDSSPQIFEEVTGEKFNFSSEEIIENYPLGLILQNPSNMGAVYLNIAYLPVQEYFEPPALQMCGSKSEISNPWQTFSSATNSLALFDERKEIGNLKNLLERIKMGEVCVYKTVFDAEPITEDGIISSTTTVKTSYMWNLPKSLQLQC